MNYSLTQSDIWTASQAVLRERLNAIQLTFERRRLEETEARERDQIRRELARRAGCAS